MPSPEGGLPLVIDGRVIGGIGVSGVTAQLTALSPKWGGCPAVAPEPLSRCVFKTEGVRAMAWERPAFVEIKMDAEINAYQDDFGDGWGHREIV